MKKNVNPEILYYWAPSIHWQKDDDSIKIEIFSYKGIVLQLFPKLYFISQKGIKISQIIQEFPEINERILKKFLTDLINKRILITTIQSCAEVFYPQQKLFANKYSDKIKYDAAELQQFKKHQLERVLYQDCGTRIKLNNPNEYPDFITNRRTIRDFNMDHPINFSDFSSLVSCLQQQKKDDQHYYYYASAGGLYPIDVYLYVKPDRVENMSAGLYYYQPVENSLFCLDENCEITRDVHYITNQNIFKSSAFTFYFVYNGDVTMPKYGSRAYLYGILDCGIIVQHLTSVGEMHGIGICSIGDLHFKKIRHLFKLKNDQVFLHAMEVGLKP